MRTRAYDWFDTKNMQLKYGIEVMFSGKWMCLGMNSRPVLFETEEERDEERAKLRKQKEFKRAN